jgi:hypothetical protein
MAVRREGTTAALTDNAGLIICQAIFRRLSWAGMLRAGHL